MVRFLAQIGIFLFSFAVRPALGAHSVSYAMCAAGIQRPGHEVDHSHTSSAKVRNEWSCMSTPTLYKFMAYERTDYFQQNCIYMDMESLAWH